MKKIIYKIAFAAVLIFFGLNIKAQTIFKTINTDEGLVDIYLNSANETFIEFDLIKWNELFPNNIVNRSTPPIHIGICLKFASRHKDCKSGVGFRCGLCDREHKSSIPDGRNIDRNYFCDYIFNPTNSKVTLTIKDNIDWDWLTLL